MAEMGTYDTKKYCCLYRNRRARTLTVSDASGRPVDDHITFILLFSAVHFCQSTR